MSRRLIFVALAGACLAAPHVSLTAQTPAAPKYKFDPDWPKTMPNKWKIGGVTRVAVHQHQHASVHDPPHALRDMDLKAGVRPTPPHSCVQPPSVHPHHQNLDPIQHLSPPP